eukprot:SM000001S04551  [mRNA]  locus=s1:911252:915307:+ [translate_table: standard]
MLDGTPSRGFEGWPGRWGYAAAPPYSPLLSRKLSFLHQPRGSRERGGLPAFTCAPAPLPLPPPAPDCPCCACGSLERSPASRAMEDVVVVKLNYDGVMCRTTLSKSPLPTHASLEERIRESFKISPSSHLTITYTDSDGDNITILGDDDIRDAIVLQQLNPLRLTVKTKSDEGSRASAATQKEAEGAADAPNTFSFLSDTQLFEEMSKNFLKMKIGQNQDTSSFADMMKKYEAHIQSVAPHLAKFLGHFQNMANDSVPVAPPSPAPATNQSATTSSGPGAASAEKDGKVDDGPVDQAIHRGVQCDICDMVPIVGPRFKSLDKDDYDLCHKCHASHGKEGEYKKIDYPVFRPRHHQPFWAGGPGYGCKPAGMRYPQFGTHFLMGRPCHPGRAPFMPHSQGKLDARFVKDVTIFDGTEILPGTRFTKIWRLRNSSNTHWPEGTQLICIGGSKLGLTDAIALQVRILDMWLFHCRDELDASVDMVAPDLPGRYVSHWRLMTPNGTRFGHRVWVLIQVVSKDDPSPQVAQSVADAAGVATQDSPQEKTEELVTESTTTARNVEKPAVEHAPPAPTAVQIPVHLVESAEETAAIAQDMPAPVSEDKGSADVVQAASQQTSKTPSVEESSVGGFSLVDMPSVEGSPADSAQEHSSGSAGPQDGTLNKDANANQDTGSTPEVVAEAVTPAEAQVPEVEEDPQMLTALQKLASMGFGNHSLNKKLLEENNLDIGKTVNDLIASAEWDPMLEELEEMGFFDTDVNRHLMIKNKGSMKRTVKDLVMMYRGTEAPVAQK